MNKTEKDAHFKSQLSQAMMWGGDRVAAKGGALGHQESGRSPRQLILSSGSVGANKFRSGKVYFSIF